MDGHAMHYSVVIQWSPEDEANIATVPELDNARTHSATYDEALSQAQDMLDSIVDVMQQEGKDLPTPSLFAVAE